MFGEEEEFEAKDSQEIIIKLKKQITEENQILVGNLVMKISLLKKGIVYENQTLL
jgi:hypothetical protein